MNNRSQIPGSRGSRLAEKSTCFQILFCRIKNKFQLEKFVIASLVVVGGIAAGFGFTEFYLSILLAEERKLTDLLRYTKLQEAVRPQVHWTARIKERESEFRGSYAERYMADKARPLGEPSFAVNDQFDLTLESALADHENFPAGLLLHIRDSERAAERDPNHSNRSRKFPQLANVAMTGGLYQLAFTSFATLYIRTCHLDYRLRHAVVRCVAFVELEKEFYQRHNEVARNGLRADSFQTVAQYWSAERTLIGEERMLSVSTIGDDTVGLEGLVATLNFPCTGNCEKIVAVSVRENTAWNEYLTNAIRLQHQVHLDEVGGLAVCLHDLSSSPFEDQSEMLVEWLEMLKLSGVDSVVVYPLAEYQHPNVSRVLRYYEEEGFVQVRSFAWAGKHSLPPGAIHRDYIPKASLLWPLQKLNLQLSLQSCILESIGRFKFATSLNLGEIILPKFSNLDYWKELLQKLFADHQSAKVSQGHPSAAVCFEEGDDTFANGERNKSFGPAQSEGGKRHRTLGDSGRQGQSPPKKRCIFNLAGLVMARGHQEPVACLGNMAADVKPCGTPLKGSPKLGAVVGFASECKGGHYCNKRKTQRSFYNKKHIKRHSKSLEAAVSRTLAQIGLHDYFQT